MGDFYADVEDALGVLDRGPDQTGRSASTACSVVSLGKETRNEDFRRRSLKALVMQGTSTSRSETKPCNSRN